MPDDHSKLAPLLPIPNRTVKRLRADDSAGSRVKVGHRQAITALKNPLGRVTLGVFVFCTLFCIGPVACLAPFSFSQRVVAWLQGCIGYVGRVGHTGLGSAVGLQKFCCGTASLFRL